MCVCVCVFLSSKIRVLERKKTRSDYFAFATWECLSVCMFVRFCLVLGFYWWYLEASNFQESLITVYICVLFSILIKSCIVSIQETKRDDGLGIMRIGKWWYTKNIKKKFINFFKENELNTEIKKRLQKANFLYVTFVCLGKWEEEEERRRCNFWPVWWYI